MKTIGYVLLSGGIDSTTALSLAVRNLGQVNVRCVSVDYGQRHKREIEHAAKAAAFYGRPHHVLDLSSVVPRTMLTDPSREIPSVSYAQLPHGISPTYVPFRNGLMLSALASYVQGTLAEADRQMAEPRDNAIIYFGAHAEDSQNWAYPDCTPEWSGAMANAIMVGTYNRVRLEVPFQYARKYEIIEQGTRLETPYHLTWSCYKGGERHCGVCPTCRARKEAFVLAGVSDPTEYAA